MWGRMVDVITCAIFGDYRLRGVGVVRRGNSPFPIDLTRRPYNTGHTTVLPCDTLNKCHMYLFCLKLNKCHRLYMKRQLLAIYI